MGEGRKVKVLQQRVEAVSALEPEMEKLHDSDLRAKTDEFRERLAGGETLDDLLARSFRRGAGGLQAHPRDAAFRRPDHGRHRAARG